MEHDGENKSQESIDPANTGTGRSSYGEESIATYVDFDNRK
jgi:hypothetical protein